MRLTREMFTEPFRSTDGRLFRPPIERFTTRFRPEGECMVWSGARNSRGYGQIGYGDNRAIYTHRAAWAIAEGSLEADVLVLHHCDNPPCGKREHLFLGDHISNAADMIAKGRGVAPPRTPPTDATRVVAILALTQLGITSRVIAGLVGFSAGHVLRIAQAGRMVQP